MSDLLATLQINAPLPGPTPAAPLRAVPVALPGTADLTPDFAAALVGLLIPGAPAKAKGERQPAAEGGKDLPVSEQTDEPVIAWLPEGMAPIALPDRAVLPQATSANGGGAAPILLPPLMPTPDTVVPASVLPAGIESQSGSAPATLSLPAEAQAAPETPSGSTAIFTEADATSDPKTVTNSLVEDSALARSRFEPSLTREGAQPTAPAQVALPPAPAVPAATSGAAAQVFATAISTAAIDSTPSDRPGDAAILLGAQLQAEQRGAVQAMSAASQAPLDLTGDDWTGQMIDRIAALRDSAEAADTRIKLAPENLGALEVSIRRDGDRIHVHFTADNPAARQLIADAAPRLAELADARGVKLGQTSVDGGGQHGSQREQQPQSQATARNASVARHADPITDDRIA